MFRSNQICYVNNENLKKLNRRHGKDFVIQIIFAYHQRSEQDDVTNKPLFHFCVVLGKTFLLCRCQKYKPMPSTSALQRISEAQPKVQLLSNISNVIEFAVCAASEHCRATFGSVAQHVTALTTQIQHLAYRATQKVIQQNGVV